MGHHSTRMDSFSTSLRAIAEPELPEQNLWRDGPGAKLKGQGGPDPPGSGGRRIERWRLRPACPCIRSSPCDMPAGD